MSIHFHTNHMKINTIAPEKHEYLRCLVGIDESPKRLYFIGRLPDERVASVAIVGSRKPTSYGKEVTQRIAFELASRGVVIIDGMAHRAALEANGTTLAVLQTASTRSIPARTGN